MYCTDTTQSRRILADFRFHVPGVRINRRSVGTKKTKFLSAQVESDRISIAIVLS